MAHEYNARAEGVLDNAFPVLNHGFVTLVDYMGGDARIEQAARVSNQLGTRPKRDREKLINYLAQHEHWSPFEKVVFEFHVKAPLFVVAQWVRHRTGSFNQESARYSVMKEEFYFPVPEDMKKQSKSNKQASGEQLDEALAVEILRRMENHAKYSYEIYDDMLYEGLARQHSRMVLPQNLFTSFFWTVNFRNLLHFVHLRDAPDAQPEIAQYGGVLGVLAAEVAPIATEAYYRHVIHPVKIDRNLLREVLDQLPSGSELHKKIQKKLR